MRRLQTIMLTLFAAAASGPLCAQSLDAFKERLAAPVVSDAAFGMAKVTVTEHGDARRAVEEASRKEQRLNIKGYRVGIFFDNSPTARDGAFAAKALFEDTYPDVKVYMVYDSPYYTVSVGNCLTKEEVIMLMGRISSTFPKAFVKNETLSIADLLN